MWPASIPAESGAEPLDGAETVEESEAPQEAAEAPQERTTRRPRIGVTATRDLVKRSIRADATLEAFLISLGKLGIEPGLEGQTGIRASLVTAANELLSARTNLRTASSEVASVSETVESLYETL